jgi:hypothetical protein
MLRLDINQKISQNTHSGESNLSNNNMNLFIAILVLVMIGFGTFAQFFLFESYWNIFLIVVGVLFLFIIKNEE